MCLSSRWDNINLLKIECRQVWILVKSSQFFLVVLKLPINPYFSPPDGIILSWLKKINKNLG